MAGIAAALVPNLSCSARHSAISALPLKLGAAGFFGMAAAILFGSALRLSRRESAPQKRNPTEKKTSTTKTAAIAMPLVVLTRVTMEVVEVVAVCNVLRLA